MFDYVFVLDVLDIVKYSLHMSSWPASERYGIGPAPGGLALVQDFLNTVAIGGYGGDLLAELSRAQAWAIQAVAAWSAHRDQQPRVPALTDSDLSRLRALRSELAAMVAGEPQGSSGIRSATASFAVSEAGEVRLDPAGHGWRWLSSALWGEVLLSQQTRTWRRLKRCNNPGCRSTFYDRSKNSSGVWHNVKTCGNAANLRASRARRRAAALD
jgi:hypothetical protein